MKECTGNERIKRYSDQGIKCWSGNDDEAHAARHEAGAQGVISVTSNVVPRLFRSLMDTRDDELAARCMPLIQWLFAEPNPIGLNTILMQGGLSKPVWRLPYVPMSVAQRKEIIDIVSELGMDNTIFDKLDVLDDTDFHYLS